LSLDEYFEGSALCHLLPNHAPDVAARLGGAYGLAAAALFGMSPPIAELLLPEVDPLLLAGLLYGGAGLGLLGFEVLFYRKSKASQ
jgi:hypothetical protein